MDALPRPLRSARVVTLLGIGILYAFFAALIPWTIGANRSAAEAAEPRRPAPGVRADERHAWHPGRRGAA